MKVVNPFEGRLLRILQGLLNRAPLEQALSTSETVGAVPSQLSRTTVELVADFLKKGSAELLLRCGAWHRERHLREGRITEGRLWERTPAPTLGLTFSSHTLNFLIALTEGQSSGRIPESSRDDVRVDGQSTLGDRIFFFFAYRQLRETSLRSGLRRRAEFVFDGLLWLAFPEDFIEHSPSLTPDFTFWLADDRAWFVELLQETLADRWWKIERAKRQVCESREMQALGKSQERILSVFLEEIAAKGRRDLAKFVFYAAEKLLRISPATWFQHLDIRQASAADQSKTLEAGFAFLGQLQTLEQWILAMRNVGYFDDGYPESQLLKADWERWEGDRLSKHARDVMNTCHDDLLLIHSHKTSAAAPNLYPSLPADNRFC